MLTSRLHVRPGRAAGMQRAPPRPGARGTHARPVARASRDDDDDRVTYGAGWYDATRKAARRKPVCASVRLAVVKVRALSLLTPPTPYAPHKRPPAYYGFSMLVTTPPPRVQPSTVLPTSAPTTAASGKTFTLTRGTAANTRARRGERRGLRQSLTHPRLSGSGFNILSLLILLFVAVPIAGLVFAAQTFGTLWG